MSEATSVIDPEFARRLEQGRRVLLVLLIAIVALWAVVRGVSWFAGWDGTEGQSFLDAVCGGAGLWCGCALGLPALAQVPRRAFLLELCFAGFYALATLGSLAHVIMEPAVGAVAKAMPLRVLNHRTLLLSTACGLSLLVGAAVLWLRTRAWRAQSEAPSESLA